MKKKAFILVGHASWGKSRTMHALKGTSKRIFYIEINGIWMVIRTQSNDDIKEELLRRIQDIIKRGNEYMIIVLCPVFKKGDEKNATEILDSIKKEYDIYFFVLHKKWGFDRFIHENEIDKLKEYGKVKVFKESEDCTERAKEFKRYIQNNLN